MKLTTSLPSAEEIRARETITMVHTKLGTHRHHFCRTRFGIINTTTQESLAISASVHRIDDKRITGYIPSKVWYSSKDDDIYLLYYTSPSLPPAARPFGDKPCYAFTRLIKSDETIDYPIDARILIDQIMIDGDMFYLFLFEESQMKNILTTDWNGNPWPIDAPEAKIYNTDSRDNT